MDYVPPDKARFTVARSADGDVLIVPAVRQAFVIVFLSIWLVMWTVGGLTALVQAFAKLETFLIVWLALWAFGWLSGAATLAWMLTGTQRLTVKGQDLEVSQKILGFGWTRLFRGKDIKDLAVAPVDGWQFRRGPQLPFGPLGGSGSVRFTYGARSRYLAPGLDQVEAQQIVDWLQMRMSMR